MELIAPGSEDVRILDSGNGMRMEALGPWVVSRQCAQAVWRPTFDDAHWRRVVQASHYRNDDGPGKWTINRGVPKAWPVTIDDYTFEIRPTGFGRIGIFPEQQVQWPWLAERSPEGTRVLNLFAYTGGSTLAAASGGAQVTHVDALKNVVQWASRNADLSGLKDAPIRWIVEDAFKFLERELRRERPYEGIIVDPPTFGRGPKGRVWKIEKDMMDMVEMCCRLLSPDARYMLLTAHTPGYTAAVLKNAMLFVQNERGGTLEWGDMVQAPTAPSPHVLPAGVYCRWTP